MLGVTVAQRWLLAENLPGYIWAVGQTIVCAILATLLSHRAIKRWQQRRAAD